MATNPMQRKARNSFLLGVFITMIIAAIVIAFLLYMMYKQKTENEEIENDKITVYVLIKDVESGTNVATKTEKGGILTKELATVEVTRKAAPETAITASNYSNVITENSLFKIDLKSGTILSTDMIVESSDKTQDDTREQEFNMIVLPSQLKEDDYVDIRLRLPSGQDYIVVSKKKVLNADEITMWIKLTEDEILTLSNAIVEAYQIDGTLLYATTYVEPGIQQAASVTYIPTREVSQLINNNPNVVQTAKDELAKRYNNATLLSGRNDIINPAVMATGEEAQSNVATGTATAIEAQKQTREDYVKELETKQATTTTTTTTK